MLDWFLNLFTLQGLFHFILGVAVAGVWHVVKARIKGLTVVFKWQYVALPFALMISMYIAGQTQQNANCVREFQQVLRYRSEISIENDQLSIHQRELIYDWIHALVFPPPDIARLDTDDPVRQQWAIRYTIQTDKAFRASIDQQHENDQERAQHPLPPATCGE